MSPFSGRFILEGPRHSGQEHRCYSRVPTLVYCAILDNFLTLSVMQFPHRWNVVMTVTYLMELLGGLNE